MQMEKFCDFVTDMLLKRNIIDTNDINACSMGLKLIASDIINFSVIVTCGFLLSKPIYSLIYIATFCGIRKFSGGFHARTFSVCRIATIGIFIGTTVLTYVLQNSAILCLFFCIPFAVCTMFKFAPIIHYNRPLTTIEAKANRYISILMTCFCSIISIILSVFKRSEGLYLAFVLSAIAVLMHIGRFANAKRTMI